MPGNLFIVAAPSGAGKTTLVRALLAQDPLVRLSVSFTTRPRRANEIHGHDYHFVPETVFREMLAAGEFLESAFVHGNFYGTPKGWIAAQMAEGHDILLEIDWQGAAQVREQMPGAIGIFILPPSLEALEERLRRRGLDQDDVIARRLAAARAEIGHLEEFDYVIINLDFDEALKDLASIFRCTRLRTAAQLARHRALIQPLR